MHKGFTHLTFLHIFTSNMGKAISKFKGNAYRFCALRLSYRLGYCLLAYIFLTRILKTRKTWLES